MSRFCITFTIACGLTAFIMFFAHGGRGSTPSPPPLPKVKPYLAQCSAHSRCVQAQAQGDCCPTSEGVLMECCDPINSVANFKPFYSMCYAPSPTKEVGGNPATDDYMAPWSQPMWGATRKDLDRIKAMNVNTIRLYGNDPRLQHKDFLEEVYKRDMHVIVALSNFPFVQDKAACATALPYDCFGEIRDQWMEMLKNGFAVEGLGSAHYHAAIKAIIVANEPELKFTNNGKIAGEVWSKGWYAKALVSAIDGIIEAEKIFGIVGGRPPFTVTHSFAICPECKSSQSPLAGKSAGQWTAVPWMYDVVLAMLRPELYDNYQPKHDLREALQQRFVLGFNTQDKHEVICENVLAGLAQSPLSGLPVWSGEYKAWYQSMPDSDMKVFQDDVHKMRLLADGHNTCPAAGAKLTGFSIFEFQTSYWKGDGDHQMDFGIYDLGSQELGKTIKAEETQWKEYPVWCLRQKKNQAGESWVAAVAAALDGKTPSDGDCQQEAEVASMNVSAQLASISI